MKVRFQAVETAGKRQRVEEGPSSTTNAERFGAYVWTRSVMEKMLPSGIYENLCRAQDGLEKIKPEYADVIAMAMKEWAISQGATHYTHWFQPLSGVIAEKHDAFLNHKTQDIVIETFGGKELIQGEPDASSFPSGGLRSTYEARGYTGWDPSSPVFIWKAGDGITLCIPSVFFSWSGDVLDFKIPLLRSDQLINSASLRLLELMGKPAKRVVSTLGVEQEYFIVDRALRNLRPDLVLGGRTVLGAPSPKGQELMDHYFGAVKDRILSFMSHFEAEALYLGIPVKTRHNEVAPAQHEVAPVFEKASLAVDHNLLLMELMRQVAVKHDLCCLLHEKPFAGLNGSGKHCNWSLMSDSGQNLLNPKDGMQFIILLVAILRAVHRHAGLLRASIASPGNDHRLGGHEAPPAIISVYLGDSLEKILIEIEEEGKLQSGIPKEGYDLGVCGLPEMEKDNTDRNRTSPFAFTGNKFEFRAVGSSANCSFPVTVINVAVAQSLQEILNEIEERMEKGKTYQQEEFSSLVMPVLQKHIKESRSIRFTGDNYSGHWQEEAELRGLPSVAKSLDAYKYLVDPATISVFEGVLREHELKSRYEASIGQHVSSLLIEANILTDMFRTQILPAALKYQKTVAHGLRLLVKLGKDLSGSQQERVLEELTNTIEESLDAIDIVSSVREKLEAAPLEISPQLAAACEKAREAIDQLELIVEDEIWPLPKYRELLFHI